ncbi:LysR family transcriptional regulator [Variovorax sp. ZS18.2.2]|uniref:LysR family transcriptional regulator n=1 Tax=Variovorax sp. ZS18.2.2 TaxID=2971255 RepID=UPI002151C921|nr:LysR family transcriptional regulator [Variovorax sp. ZS18.2.2]MCR6475524.1 LysR family transcriptional regulator [Variovorax sp. ZS18.2.2]
MAASAAARVERYFIQEFRVKRCLDVEGRSACCEPPFLQTQFTQMNKLDWNDLRYVLAAVRNGSAAAAARALRISHATVLRRIQGVEAGFGLKIFGRTTSGHELTKEGRVIFELAEFVEAQVTKTQRLVDAQGSEMEGEIRFTTTDALFAAAVMPLLESFHKQFPAIKVQTSVGSAVLDIEKREADIALRPSIEPPDSLVGLRLCRLDFSVYASPLYLSQNTARLPRDMAWLMPDESLSRTPIARWLKENLAPSHVLHTFNSFIALRQAAEADLGATALPRFLGRASTLLVAVASIPRSASTDLWLLTHPNLRHTRRVQAFMDHIAQGIRAQRTAFESSAD